MGSLSLGSLTANPGVQIPAKILSSFVVATTFSSGSVWLPSLHLAPYFILAVATLAALPFFAAPPNITLLAMTAVASPVLPGFLLLPPDAHVRDVSFTPRLSTALEHISYYVVSWSLLFRGAAWLSRRLRLI